MDELDDKGRDRHISGRDAPTRFPGGDQARQYAPTGHPPGVRGIVELNGHRGAAGLFPENTLIGFANALRIGVSALELDVMLTADDVPVVTHDLILSAAKYRDTVPAVRCVGRRIRDLSLAELQTVRWHDSDLRIPTFGQVAALLQAFQADQVGLLVELKSDPSRPDAAETGRLLVSAVGEILAHHRLTPRATIMSFDWSLLPLAAQRIPSARRCALAEPATQAGGSPWLAGFPPGPDGAVLAGAHSYGPDYRMVDADLMTTATRAGSAVVPWTVNDPRDMARLITLGVAGLTTDFPDRLRTVVAAAGLPLPVPVGPLAREPSSRR